MQAQDYSLSNHNVVPFSLNLSSVGAANTLRLGVNYRMQWPMLSNNYHTVRVSYDQNVYKQMCSVGAAYSYDQMSNVFGVHEFDVVYAHTIKCADKHFIRLGLQGSVISNQLNLNNVTFGDQYDEATGNILSSTVEGFENQNKTFFDFSVGFQLYYVFDLFTSDKKNGSWSNELSLIYTMPAKKKCECPVTYW